MIRKRALWLALITMETLGVLARAQGPQKLTLQQAEALALQNHPQVQAAQFSALAANQVTREVSSAYYPFAYGNSTVAGSDPNARSRIAAGGLNNPIVYNRFANGVSVGEVLTDFGRTQNLVASSRLESQAASENLQATRQAVLLAVDSAYYNALSTQAVLSVAQKAVEDRQVVADEVKALAESKLKSSLDVSFAEVNLAQAKLDLVQDQSQMLAAFATLAQALGYAHTITAQLEETPLSPAPPPDASPLIDQAFRERPNLIGERFNLESSQRFAKAERDLSFPTVSALATAGVAPYRQKVSNLGEYYSAAGVNVSIPIFNGHLFGARRAQAELKARAENERLREEENAIAHDVQVAWLNANTAYQRLSLTRQLLDQANLALSLAQARYKLGLSSIVELSQAELSQTQAEVEQARAKYEFQARYSALEYQIGALR